MGQLAIVNAPSSFAFIWSMIKPWLSKETAEKVDILGSDYKKVLLDLIDAENLPSTLGGNCTCEGGCHLSSRGPWLDGRTGWGPNSKAQSQLNDAKNDATSDDTTTGNEHLEIPNGLDNAPLEEKGHTGGISDTAKPSRNDAQKDQPLGAAEGLQQETVEPQAEIAAVTAQA